MSWQTCDSDDETLQGDSDVCFDYWSLGGGEDGFDIRSDEEEEGVGRGWARDVNRH